MKLKTGKITCFMDMHSGGKLKTPFTHIYVDGPLDKALAVFKDTFKRDPNNITCKCCGEDFFYEEYESLEDATAYDRGTMTLEKYFSGNNKVILITE
jgi:hypothetical protein